MSAFIELETHEVLAEVSRSCVCYAFEEEVSDLMT